MVLSGLVAFVALISPPSVRPYVIGAGLASVFWYGALTVVVMAGTGTYLLGADGERWTSDELRKLTRHGWRLVEHVPLAYGDIDHVLIGPGGVYAVETKNTSGRWDLGDCDDRIVDAVTQARRCADRLRALLLEHSVRLRAEVRPLVVVWGRATADRATVDGVDVIHGSALAEWTQSLSEEVLSSEQVATAFDYLQRYVAMRDAAIEKERGKPSRLVEVGPLAILSRMYTVAVGFLAAIIAMAGALKLVGDGFFIPVLLVSTIVGVLGLRHVRRRHLAIGWLVASGGTFVALLGWVLLSWTGTV
jgi:hypothetical protein